MKVFAAEPLATPIPQTLEATLVSNTGEVINVIGEKVNAFAAPSGVEASDESVTYRFSLYSSPSYSLTASEYDGSISVQVFLTINYTTQNASTEYLLTGVSGSWDILDRSVNVASAQLTYGCSGVFTTQTATVNVSNNFSYSTGFTNYVPSVLGSMGANLALTLQMGTTRYWDFYMYNNLF